MQVLPARLKTLLKLRGVESPLELPPEAMGTFERWQAALTRTPTIEDIRKHIEKEIAKMREEREGGQPPDNDLNLLAEIRVLKKIQRALDTIDQVRVQTEAELDSIINNG